MPKKNNMRDALERMGEMDVYSMLLYMLFRLKDDPKYSTLSMLVWALDKESLLNFLRLFDGQEIKVPDMKDLMTVITVLQLYHMVNLNGMELEEAISRVVTDEIPHNELMELYARACNVMGELVAEGGTFHVR